MQNNKSSVKQLRSNFGEIFGEKIHIFTDSLI